MKVLACQISVPAVSDAAARDAHLARLAERLDDELAREPADLVVLPELSSISYSRDAFEALDALGETETGPSFQTFRELAVRHRAQIAFGIPRRADGGFHIAHVVVDAAGECAGYYDKLHTAQFGASVEKEYFQRGSTLLVFDVDGIRVAPVICYDFRFPELVRRLSVELGADLIIHPVAFYRDASFPSWHHFAVCRAMENQVYFLSLNRAGEAWGSSIFCPPWVDDETPANVFDNAEEFRRLRVDPEVIRRVRSTYRFRAERLDDYGSLPPRFAPRV